MNSDIKITVLTSLFNCSKYLDGYFNCLIKLHNTNDIEVLLLHNEPSNQELLIINQWLPFCPFVKHIIIPKREGLYTTWNRGVDLSNGDYICIWNVDDIRMPNSISAQADTLDKNPDADLTYGDFYYMFEYSVLSNVLVVNKDFAAEPLTFFRSHQIGCFPMWKKELHSKVGYFDEQLKLVADFDFQIRVAHTCRIVKTKEILGYYLEYVPEKLSCNSWLQIVESNVLNIRYGMFDLFNWLTLAPVIKKYSINYLFFKNISIRLSDIFPILHIFIIQRIPLIFLSVFRQPRFILAYLKHNVLGIRYNHKLRKLSNS